MYNRIENLRSYLSNVLESEAIFLYDKPVEFTAPVYLLYKYKPLDGGKTYRSYQIDMRVVSKDKLLLLEWEDKIVKALDFYYKKCDIEGFRDLRLLNGGGMAIDEEHEDINEYSSYLFFKAII